MGQPKEVLDLLHAIPIVGPWCLGNAVRENLNDHVFYQAEEDELITKKFRRLRVVMPSRFNAISLSKGVPRRCSV
jgi:hypothetical protein